MCVYLSSHEKKRLSKARRLRYPVKLSTFVYVPCHHDSIPVSLLFPQNAVHNIVSVPKKPAKIVVDTVGGDKLDLEPSGLEPKFVHKKVHN